MLPWHKTTAFSGRYRSYLFYSTNNIMCSSLPKHITWRKFIHAVDEYNDVYGCVNIFIYVAKYQLNILTPKCKGVTLFNLIVF